MSNTFISTCNFVCTVKITFQISRFDTSIYIKIIYIWIFFCVRLIMYYKNSFFTFVKVSSIPFPSRTLFANTETVAQSRKRQLELYLRRLIDTCKNHPACPLAYGGPITKPALISFSPFFKKGVFENGKYGTSWLRDRFIIL